MYQQAWRRRVVVLFCLSLASTGIFAHEGHEHGPAVVPQAERDLAAQKKVEGPTQNKGIKSVTVIGGVTLASEFPALEGRQMRVRELVIEPGGVVAVHQHDMRPGMAYILEGEIVEHRNDHAEPVVRKKGDAAFEKTGVTHWWENKSTLPVRALVVDIVPLEAK
ncbi:MAG: cupin domain-containing protein [Gammaproteobacteria bacterium]|nr:cupin domain-containing protein [Gammaproteobacteria bacterium]